MHVTCISFCIICTSVSTLTSLIAVICTTVSTVHTNIPHCFSYRPATRTLRSTELTLLEVPLVSRTHSQQAISFTGPTIYNDLPLNIRSLENYDSFKFNLKHHIRQN